MECQQNFGYISSSQHDTNTRMETNDTKKNKLHHANVIAGGERNRRFVFEILANLQEIAEINFKRLNLLEMRASFNAAIVNLA